MAKNFFARFTRTAPRRVSVFDGQDLKRALLAGQAWLEEHREAINALNVFPVPDGDTGTNMSLTMRAATKAIADSEESAAYIIAEKLSRGALMGARGNSGVILSQILRGLSHGLDQKKTFTAKEFAAALQEGARHAYRAVIKPVEGTILTVVREAAEAAQQSAARGSDFTQLLEDTVFAARTSVAKTPELLPTLKHAGVVDAGGQGLTMLLEGIWRYARGETVTPSTRQRSHEQTEVQRGAVEVEEEFGYEVVFLLHGERLDLEGIRDTITAMGGVSTVVAGDETLLKVHTHTPTPGKILDYGVSLGSLEDINIENLQAQSLRYAAESRRERGLPPAPPHAAASTTPTVPSAPPEATDVAMVVVASGPGWMKVFHNLGVSAVVPGGQTMNPSTEELLAAVEHCAAEKVILLPNNSNVVLSARQVPSHSSKRVYVIPTDSMPQAVSALLAYNPDAEFEANCAAMEAAAARISAAEITRAVRSVQLDGIQVTEGDVIGLVDGKLVTAGREMEAVVRETLQRMHAEQRELATVYYGQGVARSDAEAMAQHIKEWFPRLEIEVMDGGQPFYAYIISAE